MSLSFYDNANSLSHCMYCKGLSKKQSVWFGLGEITELAEVG